MIKSIVFFDDNPMESENALFVIRLRRHLRERSLGIHVEIEKSVRALEEELTRRSPRVLILDIMAKLPPEWRMADSRGGDDDSSLAGVEILQRCRAGAYGEKLLTIPIFMRTTRGEDHVREMCLQNGATDYFLVGADDDRLIAAIINALGN